MLASPRFAILDRTPTFPLTFLLHARCNSQELLALAAETVKLAKKLMTKSPNAMRYTKEAIRAVRRMGVNEADDYLTVKNQACKMTDKISGRDEGMRQFLDEKSYRPGLGQLDLKKAARRKASSAATPTIRVRARKNKAKKKK